MEQKENLDARVKNLFFVIGILVLIILVLLMYIFFGGTSTPSAQYTASWCKNGDSWKNPINGEDMIRRNIMHIDAYTVCLAASSQKEGRLYAFNEDESVIYKQTDWQNFTKIR